MIATFIWVNTPVVWLGGWGVLLGNLLQCAEELNEAILDVVSGRDPVKFGKIRPSMNQTSLQLSFGSTPDVCLDEEKCPRAQKSGAPLLVKSRKSVASVSAAAPTCLKVNCDKVTTTTIAATHHHHQHEKVTN